ncbi:hypothetical protein DW2_13850 [Thioclava atlantica]|uniref:Uncharacterized protein n=2 Tax=Rhodobacterales TaxID=204455 RepID=A0A0B5EB42_9RHOB|nr:hypothetical protein P73_4737 [Celeribacter indicus]KFE34368.1 hypothetical protein DW2_13850 [Thioclava atlantica]
MATIMNGFKIWVELCGLRVEEPIVKNKDFIAINIRGYRFFDDQRSVEPTSDLFDGAIMRVKPKSSCIWNGKIVVEGFACGDGILGEPGHAVHRI